jgi:hypothetical protein
MVVEKLLKIRQDTIASFEFQSRLKGHFAESALVSPLRQYSVPHLETGD